MTVVSRVLKLYLSQAKRLTQQDRQAMLRTWYDAFTENTYSEVDKALTTYVKHGKPFMPNPPDIINEMIFLNDFEGSRLFNEMENAADMAVNPTEHIVIDDLGGLRWSEELQRDLYYPPETHMTQDYTQADFAGLSKEVQLYAGDVYGLKHLHNEITSNRHFARQRFIDSLPSLKRQLEQVAGEKAAK